MSDTQEANAATIRAAQIERARPAPCSTIVDEGAPPAWYRAAHAADHRRLVQVEDENDTLHIWLSEADTELKELRSTLDRVRSEVG